MIDPEDRATTAMARPTTAALVNYFLYLGSLGFGGPVALVGYMQRDLVERRRWFTKEEYMKSLALSQLAPGPLAAQLAICLGYVHSRVAGATLVALAFILPSFVMTIAISWLYVRFGGLPWMQAAFYGVGAAVIGIIVLAAYKLAKLTMANDKLQWVIFAVMAVVTAWTESEIAWLFLLSGVVTIVAQAPPAWLKRSAPACFAVAATPELLATILLFFAQAGAFIFGSGLAIVPFLYGGRGPAVRLAERPAVPGRGRRGDAHARAHRHYGGVHRLSRSQLPRRGGGRRRRLLAGLPVRRGPIPVFRSDQRQCEGQGFRRRRDRGGLWHDCGGLLRPRPARDYRRPDAAHRSHGPWDHVAVQDPRTPAHRGRRRGGPDHEIGACHEVDHP
jgi:chromate transport protein ChrA